MFGANFKIVSGGQTGADRSALDWAIGRKISHGGWCPQGRLAEDGTIGLAYALQETPSPAYLQRTEWNVRDSCGTVIFSQAGQLTGGSLATFELARQLGKPCLHLTQKEDNADVAAQLLAFIRRHKIKVLNVAGPAETKEPGVGEFVRQTFDTVFFRRRDLAGPKPARPEQRP